MSRPIEQVLQPIKPITLEATTIISSFLSQIDIASRVGRITREVCFEDLATRCLA